MPMTMTLDLNGLRAGLSDLQHRIGRAARPAAQAGAQVLYDRVKLNVSRLGTKTGRLQSAIYQVYSQDNSVEGGRAVYHVSWNRRRAPHGHLLEAGFWRRYVSYIGSDGNWYTDKARKLPVPVYQPGAGFLREAKSQEAAAIAAMKDRLYSEVSRRA